MAGSNAFHSDTQKEEILFWVVVQACRDIVYYNPESGSMCTKADFLHAYEWIMDDKPQDTVIDVDENGEFIWAEITFTEALLELDVDPRNVEHIRHAIARGPGMTYEEKKQFARDTHAKLEGQAYEPEPWWRSVQNLIMNKEPA
jgi:hypothetical protein